MSLAISIAVGGTMAIVAGNILHSIIERYFVARRQKENSRKAGIRIAARVAAGEEV
jgi:hypothetical protein